MVGVKKVAVTLPDELYAMVERARAVEHRSRSEVIQEALRSHFGGLVYRPTEQERDMLDTALEDFAVDARRPWEDVRADLQRHP